MAKQTNKDKAGVIIFPPLLYMITLLAGIIVSILFPYAFLSRTAALIAGGTFLAAGMFFIFRAANLFVKNKTTVHPAGSTRLIISSGIYRYSRNPMYAGFTLIFTGISLVLNAWVSFLLLLPLLLIVQKGIIKKEENYLAQKFGDEYLRYKSAVRRWL